MARTRRSRARDTHATGPEPIDIPRIVEAALGLLDEVGLEGLSMRKLAERLGVQAATLYWYVEDKQELLSLLAEAICGEIPAPDPAAPWRARLEALMGAYRRVLLRHRDAGHVLAATAPSGTHRLRLVDSSLGALLDAGFRGWGATRAGRLLVDYTTGFVQEEDVAAERVRASTDGRAPAGRDRAGLPKIAQASPDAYPHVAALGPYLLDRDGDARFAFGLGVLLDGLERRRAACRQDGDTDP